MEGFDPYRKWLGIPPHEQPPNHYRLLGIGLFESDADVIANAADRQMFHIRTYQSGPYADISQFVLNELSAARVCLLDPPRKAEYDQWLRQTMPVERQMPPPPRIAPTQAPLGGGFPPAGPAVASGMSPYAGYPGAAAGPAAQPMPAPQPYPYPAPRAAVGAGGAAVAPRPILVQPNDPQAADPAGSGGFYSSLSMPAARDAHPTRRKKKSVETTMAITIALLALSAVLCICFLVYYLNSANPWGSSAEDQPLFGPGRVVIEHKPAPAPAPPAVDTKIKSDAKIKKASPVNQMVKPRAAVRRPPVKVIHGAEEDVGGDLKFTPHVEKPAPFESAPAQNQQHEPEAKVGAGDGVMPLRDVPDEDLKPGVVDPKARDLNPDKPRRDDEVQHGPN